MKMLQLQFQITNPYGTKDIPMGAWKEEHDARCEELCSTDDVGRKVNAAINGLEDKGFEIIDIRTDFATVDNHNNGGCNTIFEYVTILYRLYL